jgi:hypothetical protein
MLGSSFARTMLLDRGITNWQRRVGILAPVLALAGAAVVWAKHTIPAFDLTQLQDLDAIRDYAQQVRCAWWFAPTWRRMQQPFFTRLGPP